MKMRLAADQTLGHGRSTDSPREPGSRSPVRKSVSQAGRQAAILTSGLGKAVSRERTTAPSVVMGLKYPLQSWRKWEWGPLYEES